MGGGGGSDQFRGAKEQPSTLNCMDKIRIRKQIHRGRLRQLTKNHILTIDAFGFY
jgi:hypothetical protein